jgi:hypothetical protein
MGCQFIVRSQGLKHHLTLKTISYGGIEITRLLEDGVAVFEISDPDAVLELVVKRKNGDVCKSGTGHRTAASFKTTTTNSTKPSNKQHSNGSQKRKSCDISASSEISGSQSAGARMAAAAPTIVDLSKEKGSAEQSKEKEDSDSTNKKRKTTDAPLGEKNSEQPNKTDCYIV